MKKIRLTESDLVRIIERVIKEDDLELLSFDGYDGDEEGKPKLNKYDFKNRWHAGSYDDDKRKFRRKIKDLMDDGMSFEEAYDMVFKTGFDDDDDDIEFLEEMKRKVRVMENRLRRKRQMRKRR